MHFNTESNSEWPFKKQNVSARNRDTIKVKEDKPWICKNVLRKWCEAEVTYAVTDHFQLADMDV